MEKSIYKVRILCNCMVEGTPREVGEVIDIQKESRILLRSQNQAEDVPDDYLVETPADEAAPKTKKAKAAAAAAAAADGTTNPDPAT